MERINLKRKMIRSFFWCVLLYTAISSTLVWAIQFGFISTSPRRITPSFNESKSAFPHLKESTFAEQFVREYLFWTKGKEVLRKERLAPFLASNIDAQGGLDLHNLKWDSYVSNASVWEIKEHPGKSFVKDITVYAETVMTSVDDLKEQKRVNRYLVLSIQKAGSSFTVVDVPYFIQAPIGTKINSSFQEIKKGEPISDKEYTEVTNFSKSFLKVYTTGEAQEIGYFLKNKGSHAGVTGILAFIEMKNLSAFQEKDGTVRVECDVLFEDLQSGANLLHHMRLYLAKDQTQWYVVKIERGGIV